MELNASGLNEVGLNEAPSGEAPLSPVAQQHDATWEVLDGLSTQHEARWGESYQVFFEAPYALRDDNRIIFAEHEATWSARITAYHSASWGFTVSAQHEAPWSLRSRAFGEHLAEFDLLLLQPVAAEHEALWSSPVQAQHEAPWTMRAQVGQQHVATWTESFPVGQQHEARHDLLLRNPVRRGHLAPYGLFESVVQNITGTPYVLKDGRQVGISGAEFSCAEDGYAWTCTLELTSISDYQDFARDDLFAIVLFGDSYLFMVESKGVSRPAPAQVSMTVSGISPAAVLDAPRAALITKTWSDPAMASAIALEVCGPVPLDWQAYDWMIPGGRLAVNGATPLSVLQQLATAVGAVVEATTQGGILVRPEFPVSVPDWESATPDHVFSDLPDNITSREGVAAADTFNRFYLADQQLASDSDRLEFEQDEGNAYAGTLFVYPGIWRTNLAVTTTRDGVLLVPMGVQYREEEQTIEIVQGVGQTSFPIDAILSSEWLDRDLGAFSFGTYSNKITVPGTGDRYSLLKLRYRTKALVYRAEYAENGEAQFLVEEI